MDLLSFFKNSANKVDYASGSTIFKRGDPAEIMYIVLEGSVDIVGAGDVVFETVGSGDIFGEMALIDDLPRSASAIAGTDCKLVKIDEKHFLYMVKKLPVFSLHIMRIITKRLRHMNELAKS